MPVPARWVRIAMIPYESRAARYPKKRNKGKAKKRIHDKLFKILCEKGSFCNM
jgi:hypothetical protein